MSVTPGGRSSLYRGVVVDNIDPLSQGRIRVKVPQIFGDQTSGWAYPAWPVGDLNIWPQDRMPANGQGVWIMFESLDNLAWFGVFGPVVEPVEDAASNYNSLLTWELPVIPEAVPITIPGTLTSHKAGIPNPDPEIVVERSPDGLANWVEIGIARPNKETGVWSLDYTRPGPGTFWYRAYYAGAAPFTAAAVGPTKPPEPTLTSTLVMNAYSPVWASSVPVTGKLTATVGGAGLPDVPVQLFDRHAGGWLKVGEGKTIADGTWSIPYTRPDQYVFDLKAVFPGSLTHIYAETTQSFAVMSIPTTTTLLVPTLGVNTVVTVSGKISTAQYGVPRPSPSVQFQVRYPATSGTWTNSGAALVPNAAGDWSKSYTTQYGNADYRAVLAATDVFQTSTSPVATQNIVRSTVTSAPSLTSMIIGATTTATGNIREALNPSISVVAGTVKLFGRVAGTTPWIDYSSGGTAKTIAANGNYSIDSKTLDFTGNGEFKVEYYGDGNYYTASTSSNITSGSISAGTISGFRGTTIDHSNATMVWNATAGATSYEVQWQSNGGAWQAWTTTTALTVTHDISWAADATWGTRLRALVGSSAGPWTGTVTANSGHAAQRKSGSFTYEARGASSSYRPDVGWGYLGDDVAQGYYSDSGRNYTGVMSYDGGAFQTWVRNNYGQDVLNNLGWNSTDVAMYRKTGSGSGSAVNITWYVTATWAGTGGAPGLAGGAESSAPAPGGSAWVRVPYAHWGGHVLLNQSVGGIGICNGLAIYRASSDRYSQYEGVTGAGNACNIRVNCSWDFQAVADKAAWWS